MHQSNLISCIRHPFSQLKRRDFLFTSLAAVILKSCKTVPDVALTAWSFLCKHDT